MATATLINQHDYMTVRAKFHYLLADVKLNLTLSRSGLKISAAGVEAKELKAVMDAFDKAWSAKAFGDNGKFMAAVLEAAKAAATVADFLAALQAMAKLPAKAIVVEECDDLIAPMDLKLLEVAPPKIVSVPRLTQEELQAAFDLVKNKKDWKARIDRTIDVADLARVMEAIVHFTGTVPYEVAHPTNPKKVIVRAAGYRAGPCN